MAGGMVIGWQYRRWKGAKVACADGCGRKIRNGITHVNDDGDPPANALALDCWRAIMNTPDPEGVPAGAD